MLLLLGISAQIANAGVCDQWFASSGVKVGKNCLSECAVISTDMGTFECPTACPEFCKSSVTTDFIFKISDLYPGLTSAERALAAQYPKESLKAFIEKDKAESICAEQFGGNRTNDESDACRHFVWAGLLHKNLGSDLAQKFLNAHEQQSGQPENEKAMDFANNRAGILVAEKLGKNKNFSDKNLVKEFEMALKRKEIIVINRNFKDWKMK